MKFLCDKHKRWLVQHPEELLPGWQRTCRLGREAMSHAQWQRAAVFFGNAWEMAELLLTQAPGKQAQQRYLDTAGDMMSALREGAQSEHCRFVFSSVLNRLEQEGHLQCRQESLSLLREFAFGDAEYAHRIWQTQHIAGAYLH